MVVTVTSTTTRNVYEVSVFNRESVALRGRRGVLCTMRKKHLLAWVEGGLFVPSSMVALRALCRDRGGEQ